MEGVLTYPTCVCGKSILHHRLVGIYAYCDPDVRSAETRSTSFTIAQINHVHRVLGHSVSISARQKEIEERYREERRARRENETT